MKVNEVNDVKVTGGGIFFKINSKKFYLAFKEKGAVGKENAIPLDCLNVDQDNKIIRRMVQHQMLFCDNEKYYISE